MQRLSKELSTVIAGQILASLGTIIGIRIITEVVSPGIYGDARLIWGLALMMQNLVFAPFYKFVFRYFPESKIHGLPGAFSAFSRRSVTALFLISAVPFVVGLYFYLQVTREPDMQVIFLALVLFGIYSLWTLEVGLLQMDRLHLRAGILMIIQHWGMPLGVIIAVVALGDSVRSYFLGWISFFLVGMVIYYLVGKPRYPRLKPQDISEKIGDWKKKAWKFSLPIAPLGLISWAMSIGNRYILDYFESPEKVGIFVACFGLASYPFTLLAGITAQFFRPIWFTAIEKKDEKKSRRIMLSYLLILVSVSGCGVLLFYLLKEFIVWLLLAETYRRGAPELILWLAGGYAIMSVSNVFVNALYAYERTALITVAYFVGVSANLVFSFVLIPRNGTVGAAQAILIGYVFYLLLLSSFYSLGKRNRLKLLPM